jgi:hypothetical protein
VLGSGVEVGPGEKVEAVGVEAGPHPDIRREIGMRASNPALIHKLVFIIFQPAR